MRLLVAFCGLGVLWGCTVIGVHEVPIVERSTPARGPSAPVASVPVAAPTVVPAAEGTYVVQRGDTLYSIALAHKLDVRDLARWNGLDDPSRLSVGQSLRVRSPEAVASAASAVVVDAPVVVGSSIEARPLEAVPLSPPTPSPTPSALPTPGVEVAAVAPEAAAASAEASPSPWIWPTQGKVLEPFVPGRDKGIDIAGKEGEPVLAAQDGQVVYSGSSLKGFGNLVIVKHDDDYVTAYAHNRQNLVQKGQNVKKGERIAELGRTEAASPRLHFEVRQGGKPIDPLKVLPAR